ncbi:MAG: DNA replication/repair protein RecF [Deltaproteobacteria bacterium]|nr:MAG: DNA replication/repair protein RecF [Deltaproteobacteria bacterium]
MIVQGIKLTAVRNLAPVQFEPGPHFNVLAGDNGQGKTNLLEAIYVAGTLRSFRTQRLADVIAFGRTEAFIGARVRRGGLDRKYEVTVRERSRVARLDGKAVRPIAKYFGDFNVVLFCPEDLRVPRGSPADRRRFLDRAVFNWRAGHLADVQAYDKVVRTRNAVLKELQAGGRATADLLDVYDEQLAEVGARVVVSRRAFLAAIADRFRSGYEAITRSSRRADVAYAPGAELPDSGDGGASDLDAVRSGLLEHLRAARRRDIARGASSVGPHRDDLALSLDGHPASAFASQGQLRAMVLAWKTAEMDLLAAAHGDPPVLLLDDVSSELDPQRNMYLFDFLRERDNQCFITTTHPRHVLVDRDRVDFTVRNGMISKEI